MRIFIAGDPIANSYLNSLIETYKKQNNQVFCGTRNFFVTNVVSDILHIHWPESILNLYPFSILSEKEKLAQIEDRLNWFKKNNTTIVHTIHNTIPHISSKLEFERKAYKLIISYSDILVHHCKKSVEIVKNNYPESVSKINIENHHPDYLIDYEEISIIDARKKIGIDKNKFVILNFGSQQKYKGEDFIESVFKKLPIKNKFLLTAGGFRYDSFSKTSAIRLKMRNNLRQRVKFKDKKYFYKTITPKELPYFISSADIVLLAHRDALNSGVLPLAATYAKPVVFPKIGCFKEQMNNWIYECYEPENESSAAGAIMNLYNKLKESGTEKLDNSVWLKENSWEKHVRLILDEVRRAKGILNVK